MSRVDKASHIIDDSINIITGACTLTFDDLCMTGRLRIDWKLFYNSFRSTEDHGLGPGFRHFFDRSLQWTEGKLKYTDQYGEETQFPFLGNDGDRVAQNGILLERVGEHRYRVSRRGSQTGEFSLADPEKPAKLGSLLSNDGWIRINYDSQGRIESITTSEEKTLRIEWDNVHIVGAQLIVEKEQKSQFYTRYFYSPEGHLTSAYGTGERQFQYGYNIHKKLDQYVDPNGYRKYLEYDRDGRCCSSKGQDGFGEVHIEYYPEAEQVMVVQADGGRWLYTISDGQIRHVLDPSRGATAYEFSEKGQIVSETDPTGQIWHYEYDRTGNPVAKTAEGQAISLIENIQSETTPYDHRVPDTVLECIYGDLVPAPDRLPDVYALPPDIPAPVLKIINVSEGVGPKSHTIEKDDLGRPVRQYLSTLRQFRSCDYDKNGNVLWYEDLDGRRLDYTYSSQDFLSEIRDSIGVNIGIERSKSGNIVSVVDSNGIRIGYTYDLLGKLVGVSRHGKLFESYIRDSIGNIIEKKSGPENSESLVKTTWGVGNIKLTQNLASGDKISFVYDRQNRLIASGNKAGDLKFEYEVSSGKKTCDIRDELGVQHTLRSGGLSGTKILDRFQIKYEQKDFTTLIITDPTGKQHQIQQIYAGILRRETSNGIKEISQFDPKGRCVVQALQDEIHPEQAWIRLYAYSDEGFLSAISDSEKGDTRYMRDKRQLLSRIQKPDGNIDTYEYDAAGSLLNCPGTTFQNDRVGRLSSINGDSVEYDDRSNIRLWNIDRQMRWFQYDSLDQLVMVRFPDGKRVEFEYDALGRLTKKKIKKKEWLYYWDSDRLMAEIAPDEKLRIYIYPDEFSVVPFMFVDYESMYEETSDGIRYFIHTNHLGVPILVMDDARKVVWEAEIEPYGHATIERGEKFYQPLRFPGHFFEPETGLFYNRFRMYSPLIKRYLQRNPVGISGGLNLYEYAPDPLSQFNVLGLIRSGIEGNISSAFQRFMRPDAESSEPFIPMPSFTSNRRTAGKTGNLAQVRNGAFTAIQTCWQLLNRDRELMEQFEEKVEKLEKRWNLVLHSSEDPSMASMVIKDFGDIELEASKIEQMLREKIPEDEDVPTHELTQHRGKRFQIMQDLQRRRFTSSNDDGGFNPGRF